MSHLVRAAVILVAAFGVAGIGGVESLFAPKASLWDHWDAHDDTSDNSVDHSAWDQFLKAYVVVSDDGVNRVAYGSVTPDDQAALDAYIKLLAATNVTRLSRAEQLPYWINLYNALTIRVILDQYPVESIRDIDISPGFFADGPWDKKLVDIEGEQVSLNDIEHQILRPIWQDPRIHYAVNCASIGCPNLLPQAFTAANTDQLMDEAARGYINHPRGVKDDNGQVVVSSIYAWFTVDFGGDEAGVIAHLKRYANAKTAALLENSEALEDAYDWSLNGVKRN